MTGNKSNKFLLLMLGFLFFVFYLILKSPPELKVKDTGVDKIVKTQDTQEINEDKFEVDYIKVSDIRKLHLYSNLLTRQSASKYVLEKMCASVISGGFYTKEYKHIGLFVSEFQTLALEQNNPFYDGFISISKADIVTISKLPENNSRISLQSGPVIIENSKPKKLQLVSAESARRIVVATTEEETEVLFMVVYNKENTLFGPTLNELPEIIANASKENNLKIVTALNLDGGSHSAFITESVNILEAQTVGSIFCVSN